MQIDKPDDTITAISTPIGQGGIGIVRISGPGSLKIADTVFIPKRGLKPSKCKTYTIHYGHIVDHRPTAKGSVVDEVILTIMRSPKSYTREDMVEINCHGGLQATKKTFDLVISSGARIAEPGEFTKRAFLNGRIDLAQAEGVLDVIRAKTEGSLKVAIDQLEGGLSKSINDIRDKVLDLASLIEASIDFPEEDVDQSSVKELLARAENITADLKGLADTYKEGVILTEGVVAIICGKPNVGKSSLMNLLLKRDRVIVSPVPGTTRDAVEEMINLRGIPIRLVDTAGITPAKDRIEREGVKRSKKYLNIADIALFVLDASCRIDKKDIEIAGLIKHMKKVVIINKTDLRHKIDSFKLQKLFKDDFIIEISVEKKINIKKLEDLVSETIYKGAFIHPESILVSNARHKQSIDKAYRSMLSVTKMVREEFSPELAAIDLKEAVYELGLIVGKSVSDDILDRIFSRFCIGK